MAGIDGRDGRLPSVGVLSYVHMYTSAYLEGFVGVSMELWRGGDGASWAAAMV